MIPCKSSDSGHTPLQAYSTFSWNRHTKQCLCPTVYTHQVFDHFALRLVACCRASVHVVQGHGDKRCLSALMSFAVTTPRRHAFFTPLLKWKMSKSMALPCFCTWLLGNWWALYWFSSIHVLLLVNHFSCHSRMPKTSMTPQSPKQKLFSTTLSNAQEDTSLSHLRQCARLFNPLAIHNDVGGSNFIS